MEKETIPSPEEILLPEEIAILRAEMSSKINEALDLGVFTSKEADLWHQGFEACKRLSHMEGLIDIIDNFVASGLSVVSKIENLLNTQLLNSEDKNQWRDKTDIANYPEKKQIIDELKNIIKEIKLLQTKLLIVITTKNIPDQQQNQIIDKFHSANESDKKDIVQETKNITIETAKQAKARVSKPEPINESFLNDDKTQLVTPEEPSASPKDKCLNIIETHLKSNQFKDARNILRYSQGMFNLREYNALLKKIDRQEIKIIGIKLQAA